MTLIVAWPDAIFVVDLRSITHGWMRGGLKGGGAWQDTKKVTTAKIGINPRTHSYLI